MPKQALPLTDKKVGAAKPAVRDYKLSDGGGMYLLVTSTGGKHWRMDYRFREKRKTLALGSYPEVSLAMARQRREAARKLLATNVDPGESKKLEKRELAERRANTFERLACAWHQYRADTLAKKTHENIMGRLERDVFPKIGDTPLDELTPRMIMDQVLIPIERRGAIEVAHRTRSIIGQILRWGVSRQLCERDLTADLRGAIKPFQRRHLPALTDPVKVGALLRAIDGFDGSPIVRCALQLHPLVVTRPGELRHAEWNEIDFETATWSIPAGKMKMKNPHIVPLSDQAMSILRELFEITGECLYLFPSIRSTIRPISDNTMNAALRRLGYSKEEMVSHGWRAVFRTLADEVLQERVDIVEAQLAHQVADVLGRAYNRTSFLQERRELMKRWGEYLESLKAGEKTAPSR